MMIIVIIIIMNERWTTTATTKTTSRIYFICFHVNYSWHTSDTNPFTALPCHYESHAFFMTLTIWIKYSHSYMDISTGTHTSPKLSHPKCTILYSSVWTFKYAAHVYSIPIVFFFLLRFFFGFIFGFEEWNQTKK